MTAPDNSGVRKDRGRFMGSVANLAGGTVAAQVLGILAMPVITRMFPPESFGLYALFIAFGNMLGAVSCLRYEQAILLPKEDGEAVAVLCLSLVVAAASALVLFGLLAVTKDPFLRILGVANLAPVAWLVPVVVFSAGIGLAVQSWQARHNRFGTVARANVVTPIVGAVTKIGGGAAGFTSGTNLIFLHMAAVAVRPFVLSWRLVKDDFRFITAHVSGSGMLAAARRYARFPLYSTAAYFLGLLSTHLPRFVLNAVFDAATVGLYAIAIQVLYLPSRVVGNAIGLVFYQRSAAVAARNGEVGPLVEQVLKMLVALSLMPFMLLMTTGPELFQVVFGARWVTAGRYAMLLAPWLFLVFCTAPLQNLLSVKDLQHMETVFNLVAIVTRAGALAVGCVLSPRPDLAVFLFGLVSLLNIGWRAHYLLGVGGFSRWTALQYGVHCGLLTLPGLALIGMAKLLALSAPAVTAAALAGMAIYGVLLLVAEKPVRDFLIGIVHKRQRGAEQQEVEDLE